MPGSCSAARDDVSIESVTLYHGTDARDAFVIPDGPAWFALTRRGAEAFAGWSPYRRYASPHVAGGAPRVLAYVPTRPLRLLALDRPYLYGPSPRHAAARFQIEHPGYDGWIEHTDGEVMLVDPSVLRPA